MMRQPASLTARLAILFAAATIITFAAVGSYLYRSLAMQLEHHDDHELVGKIEQFRYILMETQSVQSIPQDPHRFVDAAAGHDGLIVLLRSPSGQVLMRNAPIAGNPPAIPVVPVDQKPAPDDLHSWNYAPNATARTVSAWGRVGGSGEQVQIVVARTLSNRMALLNTYRLRVLGAMLAGAALAMMMGYLVVRRAMRPIKAIARQAHSITAQRLSTRLDAHAVPTELQTLVESFNAVLDRLQESFQRLSQFSADLAHDLRTPLYNLTMQTQVALSKQRAGEEYQTLLLSSLEEYERLSRMVESMLFLARADNAQVALTKSTLDAQDELQRIAEYFEGIADDAGVSFAVEADGTVTADAALFRRAVGNLVANAIRYTAPGAAIRLAAGQTSNGTVISVTNPGTGIDAEHIPKLFDRFYRADAARSHSASSTGLGLAIVQSIMKLHGGTAEVNSVPDGETTFRLSFPHQA